jgi:NitT/TauT family transport system substrate-binding protein
MKKLVAVLALALSGNAVAQTQEITYLLPAPGFLPAFAPWQLAQQRGYFAQEGLKVNFVTAKGGVDAAVQVGAGNAPVGGAIGDTPIIARAQGVPVKAVALLGGRALAHLAVHDGKGINGPKDLKGRTVSVMAYQDTTYYVLLGMMASAGLKKNDVDAQAAGPAGVWQLFAAGKTDAMSAVPEWIVNARDAGAKVKVYESDQSFNSMAQIVIASEKTIKENPELVRKVVRATLKGLRDIMQNPKAVVADYIAAVPQYKGKEPYIEQVLTLYTQLVYPGQKTLGVIDPARLTALQKFYVSQGIVQKETPIGDLYTNEFVQ